MVTTLQTGFGAKMGNISELELAIGQLDVTSRQELLARLAYQDQGTRFVLSTAEQVVWDAVCEVCKPYIRSVPPVTEFSKSFGKDKLRTAIADINNYVDESCGTNLSMGHRRLIVRTVFQCMVEYIHSWTEPKPITVKTMFQSVSQLAHAVDICFPGYARARMLHRVVAVAA